jgi:hypothetical protein
VQSIREATNDANKRAAQMMSRYFLDHPEMVPKGEVPDPDDYQPLDGVVDVSRVSGYPGRSSMTDFVVICHGQLGERCASYGLHPPMTFHAASVTTR